MGATNTVAFWVKLAKSGANPIIEDVFEIDASNQPVAFGTTITGYIMRDYAAWYHVCINSNGLYINGDLVSASPTVAGYSNKRIGYDGSTYGAFYIADFRQPESDVAVTSFGESDATTGQWVAKDYNGSYGTNGSELKFGSSGALGDDTSGNTNDWTVNGTPVQTSDTPSDNYCVLNPLDATTTLSNGNLTTTGSTKNDRGTFTMTSGKWYYEIKRVSGSPGMGVAYPNVSFPNDVWGNADNGWNCDINGTTYDFGTMRSSYVQAVGVNGIVMIAVDIDNGKIWHGVDGTWSRSGDPAAGTGESATFTGGTALAPATYQQAGSVCELDFGQLGFTYSAPTGFSALSTSSLDTTTSVTTSGSFTGNASADGPFIWANGILTSLSINGNSVTPATHADLNSNGFKVRTSSASYNTAGSNTWTATSVRKFVYANAQGN